LQHALIVAVYRLQHRGSLSDRKRQRQKKDLARTLGTAAGLGADDTGRRSCPAYYRRMVALIRAHAHLEWSSELRNNDRQKGTHCAIAAAHLHHTHARV
jgi:hypothetical protein